MLNPNRCRFKALLWAGALLVVSVSEAAEYKVISGPRLTTAFGINQAGEVAGTEVRDDQRVRPAVGKSTGIVYLPGLMADGEGRLLAINDRGDVAGDGMTPAPPPFEGGLVAHAYYWSAITGPIDLTPAITGASFAYAINNHGVVVGYRMEGVTSGPFIWKVSPGGQVEEQRIGEPESTTNIAFDVNDQGIVAGTHFEYAWVFNPESGQLDELPNSFRGGAYGLNDRNEVVGHYRDENFISRAAMWRRVSGAWMLEDLGVLPDPHASCLAIDINNAGTVIGECIGPSGVGNMPFIRSGGRMQPVDELVVDADASRWRIVGVYDINESGRILAAGRFEGERARVVILDPIVRRTRPARR